MDESIPQYVEMNDHFTSKDAGILKAEGFEVGSKGISSSGEDEDYGYAVINSVYTGESNSNTTATTTERQGTTRAALALAPRKGSFKALFCILAVAVAILFVGTAGSSLAVLFSEVAALKSEIASLQTESVSLGIATNESLTSINSRLDEANWSLLQKITTDCSPFMQEIVTADHHNTTPQQNVCIVSDEFTNQQFQSFRNDLMRFYDYLLGHITSCASLPAFFTSGHYYFNTRLPVYCDMTRSCGGVTGGWMRVAYLDMTNSSHQCPGGLRQRKDSSILTCVQSHARRGCSSVIFPTHGLEYSRVCGKIIAYQFGTTNAFGDNYGRRTPFGYVDGVGLSHGNPKQHIWTFAAALDETNGDPESSCPCITGNAGNISIDAQSFVGNDYFCDTGNPHHSISKTLYADNPLWDGVGCGSESTCCSFNTPPWFHKQLPQPTSDDIEMRVCRDEPASNEDVAIETVEIYVQ